MDTKNVLITGAVAGGAMALLVEEGRVGFDAVSVAPIA